MAEPLICPSCAQRVPVLPPETDRDWLVAQDWKDIDGAIAWHLIYRHADGWGDTGAMMEAWLAAHVAKARAAILEEAAALCDDMEEKPWYGYENPNTFQGAQHKCAEAIRALIGKEPT